MFRIEFADVLISNSRGYLVNVGCPLVAVLNGIAQYFVCPLPSLPSVYKNGYRFT